MPESLDGQALELAESWINGNRSHVINEILGYRRVEVAQIILLMVKHLSYASYDNALDDLLRGFRSA